MKTGGSNYVIINWDWNNPLIGTYHLFRDTVTSNLREMYEHGQRKISLCCFFGPITFPSARDHRWAHIIDSKGGVLCEQHQQNLVELLALIKDTGFNLITFRFLPALDAWPTKWTEWNREQFLENWQFMDSVRNLIVANTTLPLIFDLGAEMANMELGRSKIRQLYVREMWRRYTEAHGPGDSCGFSILHGADGLKPMIDQFRLLHLPFPAYYGFDAYKMPLKAFTESAPVLARFGEEHKPVYMQETHYNDAQSYAEIKAAVAASGLNFQFILQWPILRGQDPHIFPDVFPKRYDNYLVE